MYKVVTISIASGFVIIGVISCLLLAEKHQARTKINTLIMENDAKIKSITEYYEKQIQILNQENNQQYAELTKKVDELLNQNSSLTTEIEGLSEHLDAIHTEDKPLVYKVSMSHYTASVDETDSTPNKTATGTKPTVGRTIAVSPDLFKYLKGKKVYIPGFGVYTVEDRMNDRFKLKVDLLVSSKTEARKKGVRHNLTMIVLPV